MDEAESAGAAAAALLATIVQPLMLTLYISKAATAPPQVEHGCAVFAGQCSKLPDAELLVNVLF